MANARHFVRTGVLLGAALLAPALAAAGTASFGIPGGGGMVADGGAIVSSGGVFLPNAGNPVASFTFVVPRDYVRNTPITLAAFFHSIDTDCTFVLVPTAVVHRRAGIEADGSMDVLAPKDGSNVVSAPVSATIPFQKNYVLSPGGTMGTIKKSDQFLIGFTRVPADPDDNCNGTVVFEAVDVRYSTP